MIAPYRLSNWFHLSIYFPIGLRVIEAVGCSRPTLQPLADYIWRSTKADYDQLRVELICDVIQALAVVLLQIGSIERNVDSPRKKLPE